MSLDEADQRATELLKGLSPENLKPMKCDYFEINELINLGVYHLMFEKIAYEIACVEFGEEYYVAESKAKVLREEILNYDSSSKHLCELSVNDEFVSEVIKYLSKNIAHAIVLFQNKVFVKIFDFVGAVDIADEKSCIYKKIEEAVLYEFELEKSPSRHLLKDWIEIGASKSAGLAQLKCRLEMLMK